MTREEAVEILEEVKTLDDSMFAYAQAYNDALDMAIEALKAQEPRVMTSSEVMDYVGYFEKNPPSEATKLPLWTESKKETGVFSGYRNVGNIRNLIHTSGLDRSYIFNQHWRCWTSRPDEKRSAETPWES